jgi:hypothetical protein
LVADGRKIATANVLCHETQSCWIRILDIEKGTAEKLPGLHGFRTAAGLLMENG